MAKISFTFLLAVFWVAVLFPGQAVSYSKSAGAFVKASAPHTQKTREIIYTIKESESLWQIAKYFGIDPAVLAEFNGLKNPDLIYPGSKLNIQVQDDFSLRVTETKLSGLPENVGDKQIVIQVTGPSRNDIFAPENPLVEVKEMISGPRRASREGSMIFRNFFEFPVPLIVLLCLNGIASRTFRVLTRFSVTFFLALSETFSSIVFVVISIIGFLVAQKFTVSFGLATFATLFFAVGAASPITGVVASSVITPAAISFT